MTPSEYVAVVDRCDEGYGVVFPDLPGCVAMGASIRDALSNARDALFDWSTTVEARSGAIPESRDIDVLMADPETAVYFESAVLVTCVPYIRELPRTVKANLSINAGVLASIDAAAERLGISRSSTVELLARRGLSELV